MNELPLWRCNRHVSQHSATHRKKRHNMTEKNLKVQPFKGGVKILFSLANFHFRICIFMFPVLSVAVNGFVFFVGVSEVLLQIRQLIERSISFFVYLQTPESLSRSSVQKIKFPCLLNSGPSWSTPVGCFLDHSLLRPNMWVPCSL